MMMWTLLVVVSVCRATAMDVPATRTRVNRFVGVSESGLEFGEGKFPGIPFKDYG